MLSNTKWVYPSVITLYMLKKLRIDCGNEIDENFFGKHTNTYWHIYHRTNISFCTIFVYNIRGIGFRYKDLICYAFHFVRYDFQSYPKL